MVYSQEWVEPSPRTVSGSTNTIEVYRTEFGGMDELVSHQVPGQAGLLPGPSWWVAGERLELGIGDFRISRDEDESDSFWVP